MSANEKTPAFPALVRFHLGGGTRLALRAAVPLTVPLVAQVGFSDSPQATLAAIGNGLLTAPAVPLFALAEAILAIGVAVWAAPRLTHGLRGWIRHLPAGSITHRRAATVGLAATSAPILGAAALLAVIALFRGGAPPSALRIAGLPLLALGAGVAGLPVRRGFLARPLGAAAALAGAHGGALEDLAAVALLLVADRVAGAIAAPRPLTRRLPGSASLIPALIAARSVGARALTAFVPALLVLGGAALFVRNNDLGGAVAAAAARLGGSLAVSILLASLAESLLSRRPPWPWVRSLPISSTRRIAEDAAILGVPAILIVVPTGILSLPASAALLVTIPFLAVRAAGAIRAGADDRAGAGGRVIGEGILAACLIAITPWLALAALALTPAALRAAARRERSLKVTRWMEIHHLAAGDSLTWSDR